MTGQTNRPAYNPLDRQTYEIIAYNAVGRGSEVNTWPVYHLTHSKGRSGWSVGVMQWDFGQDGRRHKVGDLLTGYQEWAPPEHRFTDSEITSLSLRLRTPGQRGNALSNEEQERINKYLRSDSGREFVNGLDREQIAYKWENVGQPLSQIPWLQELSRNDPSQAAEIVAMASKRFNQGETRGLELIRHLQGNEMTSVGLSEWIDVVSARPPAARGALLSGRDAVLDAVQLVNSLEQGDGRLSQLWREELHIRGNVGLTQGFNYNTNAQLFDGMMRDPAAGARILSAIDEGMPARPTSISGHRDSQLEMARIELDRDGTLNVRDTRGIEYQMTTSHGWHLTNPEPVRRAIDEPDHTAPGRAGPSLGRTSPGPFNDPYLDRAYAAAINNDSTALDRIGLEFTQSQEGQRMLQWGQELYAQQQLEQQRQAQEQQMMQERQGPVMTR